MQTLRDAPIPILSMIHGLSEAITLNAEGRWGEAKHLISRVVARLDAGVPALTSAQEHRDLLTGALLLQGINASYRERSDALAVAKRLEGIGTQLAAAAAFRVYMTYHLCRAEHAESQHYRRLLDLQTIQHGTQWQVDWIAIPIEGLAGAIWSDLTMLSRALNRFEERVAELPVADDFCETLRIDYHYRRGDFARVAALGDTYIERHAPGTLISWTCIYGVIAFAYIHLGKLEHARTICERAFQYLSADDREFIVMILPLEGAYATALALLGERERAEQILHARLVRQQAARDHVCEFRVLEYRLEMLRMLSDEGEQVRVLNQMREAAEASLNPTLIARVALLLERQSHRKTPLPADHADAQLDRLDTDETSAVSLGKLEDI